MLRKFDKPNQITAALAAVAVEQILAGIDIERRPAFRMERAESHKLLSHPDAARRPVAALQVLQQRNTLFELFQILAHGIGVPSRSSARDGGQHSQARMVGGTSFLKPAAARSDAETGKRWARTMANRRGGEPLRHTAIDRL